MGKTEGVSNIGREKRLSLFGADGETQGVVHRPFCVFGFLATFEPTNNPRQFMAFRIGYSVIGLGCIAGVILLIVNAAKK